MVKASDPVRRRKPTKDELKQARDKRNAKQRIAEQPQLPDVMDVIVVGGCANGVLLRAVKTEARYIELSRPNYIKPLESAFQKHPEVVKEKDTYEVHPIALTNSEDGRTRVFGVAVIAGQSLTWAYSQLVIGFVQHVTNELIAEGLIDKEKLT